MSNIQKLIDSTIINHGGVPATKTKTQRMAGVIELLVGALLHAINNFEIDENQSEFLEDALQQAETIAGGE
jgi:hypothetical protein